MTHKYKTLIVDPPWDYGTTSNNHQSIETLPNRGRKGQTNLRRWPRKTPGGSLSNPIKPHERVISSRPKKGQPYLGEQQYAVTDGYEGVMNVKAVKQFSLVKELADDAALCFLWTTNRFLRDAYDVIEAWGFKNIPLTMVWDKGMGPQFPLSPAYSAEFVVVGKTGKFDGKPWLSTKAFNSCFYAKPGKHSEKPAYFYQLIQRVTRGPRIDIFARRRHLGFDAFGNQVEPLQKGMFDADYPKTNIIELGTGELHSEDWESWENKKTLKQTQLI